MHEVTTFSRVMNAPSILERKDCGGFSSNNQRRAHVLRLFSRYVQTGEGAGVRAISEQVALTMISPKLIEPIARRKCRKGQKSLFSEGNIVRGKEESNFG